MTAAMRVVCLLLGALLLVTTPAPAMADTADFPIYTGEEFQALYEIGRAHV